jgi:hypothetical protein
MLKSITRLTAVGALAAAAVIALVPQSASALQFQFNSSINPREVNVTRDNPPGPGTGALSIRTNAGAFDMTERTLAADNPFFGTGVDFIAWCFDLDTTISAGTFPYAEAPTLLSNSPPYQNPGALGRVTRLFDSSYDPTRINSGNAADALYSAAFQVAIWNTLYDTDSTVATGSFLITGTTGIQTLAGQFLMDAANYNGDRIWRITTFDSPSRQDLGVATAIPLPAAAWLLLAASGGLIAAKRRRAAKA